MANKKTINWVREEYFEGIEQNLLSLKPELGFATQRAIVDNLDSLDETPSRKSLLDRIKNKKR